MYSIISGSREKENGTSRLSAEHGTLREGHHSCLLWPVIDCWCHCRGEGTSGGRATTSARLYVEMVSLEKLCQPVARPRCV